MSNDDLIVKAIDAIVKGTLSKCDGCFLYEDGKCSWTGLNNEKNLEVSIGLYIKCGFDGVCRKYSPMDPYEEEMNE